MNNKNSFSTAFLIRTSKAKEGQAPVYCRITVNSQRAEFSIKRSVQVNLWNSGQIKGNSEESRTLKSYIKQVEAQIFGHYREMLAGNEHITAEALKNAYLGLKSDQHSLLELIEYHNTQLKNSLEWGTLKNYFTTQRYIEEFLKEKLKKKDIYLSELSLGLSLY